MTSKAFSIQRWLRREHLLIRVASRFGDRHSLRAIEVEKRPEKHSIGITDTRGFCPPTETGGQPSALPLHV